MPLRRITFSNANAGPVGRFNPRSIWEMVSSGQVEVLCKYGLTHVCVFTERPDVVSRKRSRRWSRLREFTQRNLAEIGLIQGVVCTHFLGKLKDFEP